MKVAGFLLLSAKQGGVHEASVSAGVVTDARVCLRCVTELENQIVTLVIEEHLSVQRSNPGKPILKLSGTERRRWAMLRRSSWQSPMFDRGKLAVTLHAQVA